MEHRLRLIVLLALLPGLGVQAQRTVFRESFDSSAVRPATPSAFCGVANSGSFPIAWAHATGEQNRWRIGAGPSETIGLPGLPRPGRTGPSGDYPSGSGLYAYVESSCFASRSRDASLLSPSIALPAGSEPVLEFFAHMRGRGVGTLEVAVRSDRFPFWRTVWTARGEQAPDWFRARASLTPRGYSAVGQTIELRFRYSGATSEAGDCAVDDLSINLEPSAGPPPPQHEYQVNSPEAALSVDARAGTWDAAARSFKCFGEALELSFASDRAGAPWMLVASLGSARSASSGGWVSPSGQVLNMSPPDLAFLLPRFLTNTQVAGVRTRIERVAAPSPSTLCLAFAVSAPSAPEGFALSQTSELVTGVGVPLPPAPGPIADEASALIRLGPGGYCGVAGDLRSMPLYGMAFSELLVTANGRILFDANASPDPSPSLSESAQQAPFVGFWTDLEPAAGTPAGSVTVLEPTPGILEVRYSQVPYRSNLQPRSSFSISLNTRTGVIILDGLSGIAPNNSVGNRPDGTAQFLGMSPGVFAFNRIPPPTRFLPVGATGSFGLEMAYDWLPALAISSPPSGSPQLVASLSSGGLNAIVFTPDASGGYTWLAQ